MDFPGNLAERISQMFNSDMDEILVFAVLFLFILLTGQSDGDSAGGFPVLLIAIFLVLFLITGNRAEPAE